MRATGAPSPHIDLHCKLSASDGARTQRKRPEIAELRKLRSPPRASDRTIESWGPISP